MGESKMIDIPDSVDKGIENIIDKPTKEIGKTIGDILYLIFGGIQHSAAKKRLQYAIKYEQFEKELREAITNIPEDKRIQPNLSNVGKILDDAKFSIEEDCIRRHFVSLLAASLNADTASLVHPSFSSILSGMTPAEASALSSFYKNKGKLFFKKSLYIAKVSYFEAEEQRTDSNIMKLREFLNAKSYEFSLYENLNYYGLIKIVDVDKNYLSTIGRINKKGVLGSFVELLDILQDNYVFGIWNYDIDDVMEPHKELYELSFEGDYAQLKIIENNLSVRNLEYLSLKRITMTKLGEQFMKICKG